MIALHAGCKAKNIRKGLSVKIQVRLHAEVFVRRTVHDVQLPVHGVIMANDLTNILPAKVRSNVLYFKGRAHY